jgi:hypothetical protein
MYRPTLLFLLFIFAIPSWGNTYYLATAAGGGSDSNNGTSSSSPWLTPNHPVNCGDVIIAAPSTAYSAMNFRIGQWGFVNCPAGNNVAWLECATFDACKININSTGHNAMTPSQSYWGIQGWEVTASTVSGNECFEAYPPTFTTTIHHIIFANDIANGCGDGAFASGGSATNVGVDYVAIVGNIAYNAAQDNAECYSGIDIVVPANSDTLPGTHIYIGGNFSWGNVDPNPCAGGASTDGQGISLDTVNGNRYTGQIVIDDNISIFNGGTGVQSFLNIGGSPNAPIYIRHNTTYGNQTGSINANPCAEINLNSSLSSQVYLNLIQTGATACRGNVSVYALGVSSPDSTDSLYNNFIYSAAGNNTTGSGAGFSFGSNLSGTNPNFSNPVKPSAPNCANFVSVPACMAGVIANFTPDTQAAAQYGYQVPSTAATYDPLFPQWLCSVNLPTGLVTMGCLSSPAASAPTAPASPVITSLKVN